MLVSKTEFPYFSRLVAATESEALVAMLREFGWSRVSIIGTDTQFASDQINEFSRLWVKENHDKTGTWTGEIVYQHSVTLDTDSVHQALSGVPTHDPTINSRVILLIAHDDDAFEILRLANEIKFQPDSIWVGLPSWCGRLPQNVSIIPPGPGYIGKMVLYCVRSNK
jgi:Receptor family ligand binding region